jgi:hypothetical protein
MFFIILVLFIISYYHLAETLASQNIAEAGITKMNLLSNSSIKSQRYEKISTDEDDSSNNEIEMNNKSNNPLYIDSNSNNNNSNNSGNNSSNSSPKKSVSFNNLVMVKVIGSNSLAFGQSKGFKYNDVPLDSIDIDSIDSIDIDEALVIGHLSSDQYRGSKSSYGNDISRIEEGRNEASVDNIDINFINNNNNNNKKKKKQENDYDYIENSDEDALNDSMTSNEQLKNTFIRYNNGANINETESIGYSYFNSTIGQIFYLLSKREILITTLLYGCNGFVQVIANEIFPLWVSNYYHISIYIYVIYLSTVCILSSYTYISYIYLPYVVYLHIYMIYLFTYVQVVTDKEDGGFNFNSHHIGIVIMVSGAVSMVVQYFGLHTTSYGILGTFQIGTKLFGFTCFLMPLLSYFNNENNFTVWFAIILGLTMMSISSIASMISVFTLINNSCYSYQRGTVNGIGQTFASIGRLFGPYFGSLIFAWSESNHMNWPFNYYFLWYVIGILALLLSSFSYLLPRTIQRRKREPKELRYFMNYGKFDQE